MEESFKADPKKVLESSNNLELSLNNLKAETLKEDLKNFNQLDKTINLIEKLSILNEYKLNLFKDFSSYNFQKK